MNKTGKIGIKNISFRVEMDGTAVISIQCENTLQFGGSFDLKCVDSFMRSLHGFADTINAEVRGFLLQEECDQFNRYIKIGHEIYNRDGLLCEIKAVAYVSGSDVVVMTDQGLMPIKYLEADPNTVYPT